MNVKPLDQITAKWQRVTAQRSPDYEQGITSPRRSWAQATKAAESNFEAGVQAAIAGKRFGSGVSRAGDQKWRTGALEKGVARWPAGVAVAGPAFQEGFSRFRTALEQTKLPPRAPKRDPRNLDRVRAVNQAMIRAAESAPK